MTRSPAPHVARYLDRVDAHLPALADDAERLRFLCRERSKWDARYSAFIADVDAGHHIDPAVTAWDFMATICELDQRIGRLSSPATTGSMP